MTSPTRTIVLATGNAHKVEELRAILGPAVPHLRLLGLGDLPGPFAEPAETGATFEANAAIKARAYAAATGMECLADDSGIEIDALSGKPGVISSHYCTDGVETGMTREARDAANNQRVLRELEGVAPDRRGARFVCVIALAGPGDAPVRLFRGAFEGRIGLPPRVPAGSHGFGYDPLFLVAPDFASTGAELDPAEKNRLSHRAQAAALLAAWLASQA
jgi:XTP/dITP diphosphohydrolase